MTADEKRKEKARNLRYRRAIAKNMNLEKIQEDLSEIYEECANIQYYIQADDSTLLDALDGDEDETYEFKIAFSTLCTDCEQMFEDLGNEYVPECFDDFFTAVSGDCGEGILGFDEYEGDYFGLGTFGEGLARKESAKRLERLTKKELIDAAQCCFGVAWAYIGLRNRYDCLKSAMDIIKAENTNYLHMVGRIEGAYEKADEAGWHGWEEPVREFDRLVKNMPQEAWVQ